MRRGAGADLCQGWHVHDAQPFHHAIHNTAAQDCAHQEPIHADATGGEREGLRHCRQHRLRPLRVLHPQPSSWKRRTCPVHCIAAALRWRCLGTPRASSPSCLSIPSHHGKVPDKHHVEAFHAATRRNQAQEGTALPIYLACEKEWTRIAMPAAGGTQAGQSLNYTHLRGLAPLDQQQQQQQQQQQRGRGPAGNGSLAPVGTEDGVKRFLSLVETAEALGDGAVAVTAAPAAALAPSRLQVRVLSQQKKEGTLLNLFHSEALFPTSFPAHNFHRIFFLLNFPSPGTPLGFGRSAAGLLSHVAQLVTVVRHNVEARCDGHAFGFSRGRHGLPAGRHPALACPTPTPTPP